jgi:DNA invertase Pin-like site-specific DNA recombinase
MPSGPAISHAIPSTGSCRGSIVSDDGVERLVATMDAVDAVGYIRVSSEEQVESGLGLDAQRKAILDYAERMGYRVRIFADEGISGSLPVESRPGLGDALSLARDGVPLIVVRRDRLARDHMLATIIDYDLQRRHSRVISIEDEGVTDPVAAMLMRTMKDLFASMERMVIQRRTKAAMEAKRLRRDSWGWYVPIGFTVDTSGKKFVPDPEQLDRFRYVIIRWLAGESLNSICQWMNSPDGCRTPLAKAVDVPGFVEDRRNARSSAKPHKRFKMTVDDLVDMARKSKWTTERIARIIRTYGVDSLIPGTEEHRTWCVRVNEWIAMGKMDWTLDSRMPASAPRTFRTAKDYEYHVRKKTGYLLNDCALESGGEQEKR